MLSCNFVVVNASSVVFTQPIQSVDGVHEAHDIDSGKPLLASGYAFSGGGRSISYVEVSADNGKVEITAGVSLN